MKKKSASASCTKCSVVGVHEWRRKAYLERIDGREDHPKRRRRQTGEDRLQKRGQAAQVHVRGEEGEYPDIGRRVAEPRHGTYMWG